MTTLPERLQDVIVEFRRIAKDHEIRADRPHQDDATRQWHMGTSEAYDDAADRLEAATALQGSGGEVVAETMISHAREPHCIGCYVIRWNDGELVAKCNECGATVALLDGVTEAMVQCGLDAALEATYARLPRYSVVRAILTAALRTKQPAASEGDGKPSVPPCKACGGRGCIDHGDTEIGSALFDCEECDGSGLDNASKQAAGEAVDSTFAEWLASEMPAGTVIGDPTWWANRIARQYQVHCTPRHPADEGVVGDSMVERAADAYEAAAESEGFGRVEGSERVTHLRFIRAAIDAALLAKSAAYEALVAGCSELAAKLDRQAEENYTDRGNALSRCADDIRLLVSDDRPSHTAGDGNG